MQVYGQVDVNERASIYLHLPLNQSFSRSEHDGSEVARCNGRKPVFIRHVQNKTICSVSIIYLNNFILLNLLNLFSFVSFVYFLMYFKFGKFESAFKCKLFYANSNHIRIYSIQEF